MPALDHGSPLERRIWVGCDRSKIHGERRRSRLRLGNDTCSTRAKAQQALRTVSRAPSFWVKEGCMTTIALTRHGHVEGINPPRFRGQYPLASCRAGTSGSRDDRPGIASTWRPASVQTSPLGQCVTTGIRIARTCGLRACGLHAKLC